MEEIDLTCKEDLISHTKCNEKYFGIWKPKYFLFRYDNNWTGKTIYYISEKKIEFFKDDSILVTIVRCAAWKIFIGYICFTIENGIVEIDNLYVNENFRGNGIGTFLFLVAVEDCYENGYQKIVLDDMSDKCGRKNNIYRKLGMRCVKQRYITEEMEGDTSIVRTNWYYFNEKYRDRVDNIIYEI